MKAWRVYEPGKIALDDLDSQTVGEDCVKLKMLSSALSISDLLIYEGKLSTCLPITIGRQGVGLVTEVGSNVVNFERGNRVVIDPRACCHTCSNCKAGKTSECERLLIYGYNEEGFMRDFAIVNSLDIYQLPERVKDNEAIFIEQIALSINAITKLNLEKGEHIVIVGAGVIGMILAQVAIYYQAVPILVDSRADRLDLAGTLGIYYTINSVDTDPYKKIFSLTGGRMAEAVAYVTSSPMPLQRTLDYASNGGRVGIIGWSKVSSDLSASLVGVFEKQLSVFGINNGGKNIPSAINMLANKTVNVAPLISKEIPFLELDKTLKELSDTPNKYIKIAIKM